MSNNIIDGYNGIMPLDLTNIDKKYHKTMIMEHKKNIEEYKLEQEKLPIHLRYENTIIKVEKQLQLEDYHRKKRIQKREEDKYKKYNGSFT
tara:strand:- start:7130 stop:7402 length:273 start_codon:yes stop_codon:yes gene_type:complete